MQKAGCISNPPRAGYFLFTGKLSARLTFSRFGCIHILNNIRSYILRLSLSVPPGICLLLLSPHASRILIQKMELKGSWYKYGNRLSYLYGHCACALNRRRHKAACRSREARVQNSYKRRFRVSASYYRQFHKRLF